MFRFRVPLITGRLETATPNSKIATITTASATINSTRENPKYLFMFKYLNMNRYFGFSLVELIVALAVVMVAILLFGVAVSSLPVIKGTRNRNIAYHAAAQKIEELRNTPFASLPGSGSFS